MKTTFACKISLHLPTTEDTFHLHTDASSYAAAAVLSQVQKEGIVLIAFYSKAFDETQMRYSILDKELYAMVNAIKHFESVQFGPSPEAVAFDCVPFCTGIPDVNYECVLIS